MKKLLVTVLITLIVVMSIVAYELFISLDDHKTVDSERPTVTIKPTETPETIDPKDTFIKSMIDEMTIQEKIGKLFYVRYDGTDDALDEKVGGIILFGQDFKGKTIDDVVEMTSHLQENSKLPLFIGTDEEGGNVDRVGHNTNIVASPFKSPQELYAEGGMDRIIEDTNEKDSLLKSLGINMNFAPVADVSTDPDDYIYDRTFGQDAEETSEYVASVVKTMKEDGIYSCLKHFPGYGNNVDTHSEIGHDSRPLNNFLESDFLPFEKGIEAGADFILVSHNIIEALDDRYPASLSDIIHDYIRNDLDFDGIIITDDLVMKGITELYGAKEAAVLAFEAGNDMLLATDYKVQIEAILEAYDEGRIKEEDIDDSLYRIIETKIDNGLIEYKWSSSSISKKGSSLSFLGFFLCFDDLHPWEVFPFLFF